MKLYEAKTGNHQGLIIEEETGRNVAVTYDKADAPPIIRAVNSYKALKEALEAMIGMETTQGVTDDEYFEVMDQAEKALALTRES
jgi:hypothetical protein